MRPGRTGLLQPVQSLTEPPFRRSFGPWLMVFMRDSIAMPLLFMTSHAFNEIVGRSGFEKSQLGCGNSVRVEASGVN